MEIKTILGAIPVLLAIPSYSYYIKTVFSGHTKPHMYSWLIWSILAGIGFVGQVSDGAGPGAWNTGVTVIGCFVIFLVSISRGEKHITKIDKSLLLLAVVAIATLLLTDNHLVAVLLATFGSLIGFVLTFIKAYNKPDEDTSTTFLVNAFRNLLSIFALNTFTFLTFFYPFTVMMAGISVGLVIQIRRRMVIR